ncbi:MAG: winged helix-turn-helix domain-containing protein [Candidatus Hodarchaeota archaeon]
MSELIKLFGRSAQVRLLQFLLEKRGKPYNLSDLARKTKLAHSTVSRVVAPLVRQGIVTEMRVGQQMRLFYLNEKNEITLILSKFLEDLKGAI